MNKLDAMKEILRFNQALDPRRVKLKYEGMRSLEFTFLRATCHLFYQNLPSDPVLDRAPLAWISGDLHLENFGSYKGDNRLSYFDMNDFDEACLAPCTWELLRSLSGILVASPQLKVSEPDGVALCQIFLDAYRTQLKDGKPRWVERPLAKGLIKELLGTLKYRDRSQFLDTRTRRKGKGRKLRIDGKKALTTPPLERKQVLDHLERFSREHQNPEFYRVLDVADRISGMGSLGVKRYVVLIEGRGSPDGNFLLDLKEARPSSPSASLPFPQPSWRDDAERVVVLQRLNQAIPPALLTSFRMEDRPFILKELQPSEHRVNLALWNGKFKRLATVISSMGELAAWAQLRSAGWRGSDTREQLGDFARDGNWAPRLIELARQRNRLFTRYWNEYCSAYDEGFFDGTLLSPPKPIDSPRNEGFSGKGMSGVNSNERRKSSKKRS